MLALFLALLAPLAYNPKPLPSVPPVTLSGAWTSIPLPAAPLGIAVHDGTIWVCGWNEMIAESTDGGRNWTVRNFKTKDGELLFSFAFFGQGKMAVFGSAGVWYSSADGGVAWKLRARQARYGLSRVVFADAKHGYGVNADLFAVTSDGGEHWAFRSYKHAAAGSMAALDAQHMALVLSPITGDSDAILATADGGTKWQGHSYPAGQRWGGILALPSGYVLYGEIEQGGRSAPDSMTSPDGIAWQRGPTPAAMFSRCSSQGCLANRGAAWAATPSMQTLYVVPNDSAEKTTAAWAADGQTFCRVSATLRCRIGREPWNGLAAPGNPRDAALPACLICPSPPYPAAARVDRIQGTVIVEAMIGKGGYPSALVVRAAPAAILAQAAVETIRTWRYTRALIVGQPASVRTTITTSFSLDH